ncbi:MAG: hypothetical protein Q8P10_00820 [bacterium]|nr:hypothetical protein [bacterium]
MSKEDPRLFWNKALEEISGLKNFGPQLPFGEEIEGYRENFNRALDGIPGLDWSEPNHKKPEIVSGEERKDYNFGWNLSIGTAKGVVGLWSSPEGHIFLLGYPPEVEIYNALIMKTLDVEDAGDPMSGFGKPIFDSGRFRAYYGSKTGEGRIKIVKGFSQSANVVSKSLYFHSINPNGSLQEEYYGSYNYIANISGNSLFNSEVNVDVVEIQKYRDKFINLAAQIAMRMGGVRNVVVDHGDVYKPDDLIRKSPSFQDAEDGFRVYKQGATVILKKRANSWSTISLRKAAWVSSPKQLADFIQRDALRI